jgi:hypothetical protein
LQPSAGVDHEPLRLKLRVRRQTRTAEETERIMNFRRIVWVGLGLGAFLNIIGVVGNGILLREAWAQAVPLRPANAMTGWPSVAISLLSDFIFGPALVWLYAAMLPRFGANIATAIRAAAIVWILGVAVPYLGIVRIGWLPVGVVAATSAVALAGFLPAAWLVVRFYRDADEASPNNPRAVR